MSGFGGQQGTCKGATHHGSACFGARFTASRGGARVTPPPRGREQQVKLRGGASRQPGARAAAHAAARQQRQGETHDAAVPHAPGVGAGSGALALRQQFVLAGRVGSAVFVVLFRRQRLANVRPCCAGPAPAAAAGAALAVAFVLALLILLLLAALLAAAGLAQHLRARAHLQTAAKRPATAPQHAPARWRARQSPPPRRPRRPRRRRSRPASRGRARERCCEAASRPYSAPAASS